MSVYFLFFFYICNFLLSFTQELFALVKEFLEVSYKGVMLTVEQKGCWGELNEKGTLAICMSQFFKTSSTISLMHGS